MVRGLRRWLKVAAFPRLRVLHGLYVPCDSDHDIAVGKVHQTYAHGLPPGLLDLRSARTENATTRRHREHLVLFRADHKGPHQRAARLHDLSGEYPLTPT